MIQLDIMDYCHDCDGFDPVKHNTGVYSCENESEFVTVECRYRNRCKAMYRHLEHIFKKEQNNESA